MALINKLTAIADAIRVQSGKTGKLTLDQMPSEIVDLQSLGFEVVGGTSAPSNPKENTIWVNTDTEIRGWQFGVDNPNLLDFTTWANNISVYNGTKSVSGNSVTLSANANDCYTDFTASSPVKIPCTPGKTYIMQWDHSGGDGEVYLFPNASIEKLVMTGSRAGKIECTATEGVTFFTFRFGVSAANTTATYSNIRITEKDRAFDPGSIWIFTGVSSSAEFNALKKNNITVYPISAKQYVSGEWVSKEAKSYQNGAWVDWLKVVVTKPDKIETYNGATYSINGNSITVKHSGTNGTAAYFGYKADLTDVKTVRVHFTKRKHKAETSFVSKSGVGILSSSQTSGVMQFWNGTFLASTINSVNNAGYVDVSVESLSGELYIWVGCYGISNDRNELEFDLIELVE